MRTISKTFLSLCLFSDEMRSTQEVKQFFTQKSLPIPTEEFGGKENAFSCSLKNVSCNLVYEGQGKG